MESAQGYARKFLEALRKQSIDKQDPVSEWKLGLGARRAESYCICTKDIAYEWPIYNRVTKKILWIGSDCAKRWFDAKLFCESCGAELGNIMKRRLEQNYLCRSCGTKERKWRERRINTLERYRWRGIPFESMNIAQLEYLINLDAPDKSLEYLREYVNLKYQVAEVAE